MILIKIEIFQVNFKINFLSRKAKLADEEGVIILQNFANFTKIYAVHREVSQNEITFANLFFYLIYVISLMEGQFKCLFHLSLIHIFLKLFFLK